MHKIFDYIRKYAPTLFIIVSCIELAMGLFSECGFDMPGRRFLLWGFLIIYFITMCCNKYTKTEKVIFAVLMVVGVVLYVSSGINTFIKAPIYIFALKGIDVRKLALRLVQTMVVTVLAAMVLNLTTGFGVRYLDGYYKGFGKRRYSLGFLHGNRLQVVVFGIVCFSVCFLNERMNVWRRIIIGVVYLVVCLLTASYTGAIVGFFVYGMSWIATYVKWDRWSDVLSVAIVCTFAFFIVISILAAAEVKGSFMEKFDHLITGRMNQLRYHITSQEDLLPWVSNWRLFSPRNHKNVYDLGYVQLFYYYGIIPAVCYLAFVFYAVYVAWRERNVLGSLAIWACGIYLFMEAAYFSNYLQRDFLLMAAAFVVMGGMGKNAEKNNTVDV